MRDRRGREAKGAVESQVAGGERRRGYLRVVSIEGEGQKEILTTHLKHSMWYLASPASIQSAAMPFLHLTHLGLYILKSHPSQ